MVATPPNTRAYHLHLSPQLGHIKGLTYLSAELEGRKKELCRFFGGVPYALPPTSHNRWRKPRPLPPTYSYGTRANPGDFTTPTPSCPQPGFNRPPSPEVWDEDCLRMNVWVPVGRAPKEGWPILVFIHGGWLQIGSPNSIHCAALLGEASANCIIICPGYRLNVFGFLAAEELLEGNEEEEGVSEENEKGASGIGNFGFYDQRMAIEWIARHAGGFGGDVSNIAVGGYSAGPSPRPLPLLRAQYLSLLSALSIPSSLPPSQILSRLRSTPASTLIAAITPTSTNPFQYHEFRAVDDGAFVDRGGRRKGFVPPTLFEDIDSGKFGQMLRDARIRVWASECAQERWLYGEYRAPDFGSLRLDAGAGNGGGSDRDEERGTERKEVKGILHRRLLADYSPATTTALLEHYLPTRQSKENQQHQQQAQTTHYPPTQLPTPSDLYGAITSDIQVHALQRGFLSRLSHLPSTIGTPPASQSNPTSHSQIHRTHISYLTTNATHANLKPQWGATHSSDLGIWFWGNGWGDGLTSSEKDALREWVGRFWGFVRGDDISDEVGGGEGKKAGDVRCMNKLGEDGKVEVVRDWDWDRGVRVWEIVREAQRGEEEELSVRKSQHRMKRGVGAKL